MKFKLEILIYSALLVFTYCTSSQKKVVVANVQERKYGDRLFLNLYQYMSQSQYLDSLYKNQIELRYIPDTLTVYSFEMYDKNGEHKANIDTSLRPIFENDSLKGILVDLIKYSKGMYCAGTLAQPHLIGMMEELYINKYGKPTNIVKSGEGSVLYWNLKGLDLYIDTYPGYCMINGKIKPTIANFTISYFNKKFDTAFKILFDPNSQYNKPDPARKSKAKEAI